MIDNEMVLINDDDAMMSLINDIAVIIVDHHDIDGNDYYYNRQCLYSILKKSIGAKDTYICWNIEMYHLEKDMKI